MLYFTYIKERTRDSAMVVIMKNYEIKEGMKFIDEKSGRTVIVKNVDHFSDQVYASVIEFDGDETTALFTRAEIRAMKEL